MNKTYKGYELYKMIAEGKIKDDCKIKDTKTKYIAIWDGYNFKLEDNNYLIDGYDEIGFAKRDFELIEDEIDIQSIEKITYYRTSEDDLYNDNFKDVRGVINELVEAVKQLDRNKEDK